jgi:hypothetical protein
MKHSTYLRVTSLAALLMVLSISSAFATAFAGVDRAVWFISQTPPYPPPPAGTFASCGGSPLVDLSSGSFNCFDQQGAGVTLNHRGSLMTSLDSVTDVTIIDPSGAPISFRSDFSAFNPGGPEIGARVDHPHFEFAQFSSSVSGPGVGDFHGCATSIATPSCGVVGPDSSSIFFEIDQTKCSNTTSASLCRLS